MPLAATGMDLVIIILREISQTEKDKYHMISLICGISNMIQMNLLHSRLTDIENILKFTKGEGGGVVN